MIKQHCDHCEREIQPGILEGLSEDDTYATEGMDSYHFHITAMGLLLCRDCFDILLQQSLKLETPPAVEEPAEGEKPEEPERKPKNRLEHKPNKPGSFMGQLSPKGQWRWSGSGKESDDWQLTE